MRWQHIHNPLSPSFRWRASVAAVVLLSGLVGGFAVSHRGSMVLVLGLAVLAIPCLTFLGDRAFAWALVIVAVAPWYPFAATSSVAPRVPQRVLAAVIAMAPLVPWLWSLGTDRRTSLPRSRWTLLLGILYAGYAVMIYHTVGGIKPMVQSGTVGFLFGGVTFLCARRFSNPRPWLAAGFGGLLALIVMGIAAKAGGSGDRIGYFVGYPITYGALVVGLLPAALLFAVRRSRLLALAVGALAAVALIWSQSRSSWAAVAVMLLVLVAVLARRRAMRPLALVGGATAVVIAIIFVTGSLRHVVETKLSSNIGSTSSVTHRAWSLGFGWHEIGLSPILGHGAPGYAAQLTGNATGISAVDNGYVSITVDMGIFGLIGAIVPIVIALIVVLRCLFSGLSPPTDLALALGILGMAVVTAFYDSFYWASMVMLMAGMSGVLSTRLRLLKHAGADRRATPRVAGATASRRRDVLGRANFGRDATWPAIPAVEIIPTTAMAHRTLRPRLRYRAGTISRPRVDPPAG